MRNFLLLCVYYIPLLILFNIELLMNRNIFGGGGEEAGVWGEGLDFGVRGNPRLPPK